MTQIETHRAVEAVWRIEAARLIGSLTKLTRDVGQAEELAQDALVAALRDWPQNGIPNNAGAWLMQTAKRRFIDHFRRSKVLARSLPELAYGEELRQEDAPDLDARLDDDVKDNVLSLIFTACHPVLGPEARAALTLRLVGGSAPPRSPAPILPPSRRSSSASCGPRRRSPMPTCRSRCRAARNACSASARCWRSSI